MIPNLNFYDIYGYLIPGFTFVILIWLPRGLIQGQWPAVDWASALVAAVIGYVVGHILQALGRGAWPSKTMTGRFPSDVLLDKDNDVLSFDLKERLRESIRTLSGIDVRTDLTGAEVTDPVRKQRRDGFYFCRDALLTGKPVTYAEQMQGMYALMSSLTIAFLLTAPYHLGWALSGIPVANIRWIAWVLITTGLIGAIMCAALGAFKPSNPLNPDSTRVRKTVALILLALLGSGYVLGSGNVRYPDQSCRLGVIVLAGLFAALTCYRVYKYFTVVYAQTIYRAFSLYEKPVQPEHEWRPFSA